MLKIKTSTSAHLHAFVSESGDDIFSSDCAILYDKVSEVKSTQKKNHY